MRKPFVLLVFGLALGVAGAARADEKIDPVAVIDKAIKATGGAEKLAKYKAQSFKAKGKFYGMGEGIEFVGEWDRQAPDKMRVKIESDVNGMKFAFIRVIDGTKAWVKFGDTDTAVVDDKDDLTQGQEDMYAENLARLLPLKNNKDLKIEVIGEAKVNDKSAIGLRVSSKGHRDVSMYFDKDKGMLVKLESVAKDNMTGGKEVSQEIFFNGYKEVEGLMQPVKVVINRDGKKYVESEVTEIHLKEKLDDKVFAKP